MQEGDEASRDWPCPAAAVTFAYGVLVPKKHMDKDEHSRQGPSSLFFTCQLVRIRRAPTWVYGYPFTGRKPKDMRAACRGKPPARRPWGPLGDEVLLVIEAPTHASEIVLALRLGYM